MPKEQSKSRKLAAKVVFAAFNILKQNGGSMRGAEVVNEIRKTVPLDEWETHQYGRTGYIRWESILHFFTIDCIKAGYMIKTKGMWTLTPEGEEALKLGPDGLLSSATAAYRDWKKKQPAKVNTIATDEIQEDEIESNFEHDQQALLDQYEEKAFEGLRNFVLTKNPYEFQDLVAALLEAMGYYISHIAAKGRDGGIDIIAYNDPLGTKQPRMVVQVKHRPDSKIPSEDIQKLVGTMKRQSDVGIFVTSGEFSNPAKIESRTTGQHVELIDFDRFIELWIQYYPKMKDEQKNMLPLQPIYFLGVNE
jgi:restriction system protein